jgi:hypothetical protein
MDRGLAAVHVHVRRRRRERPAWLTAALNFFFSFSSRAGAVAAPAFARRGQLCARGSESAWSGLQLLPCSGGCVSEANGAGAQARRLETPGSVVLLGAKGTGVS